ncbi:formylglycine-generating enzyme family protein [Synechocystis sp. PCC 7339]|nr:formylglycine-generating enzyme family protein [Synechocystis sp. PCC 7338]UAJ71873.1 formylglycine-generating enzyme family protein [Synechocystis sp. PCC 7339]
MGNNSSYFSGSIFKPNPKNPVEQISWNDGQSFCKDLVSLTSKKYRLPTEAEWEYACRAGTQTLYSFGDDEVQLEDYAWYSNNSGGITHPVGQKKPNPWGLYDMHGNVWEWCDYDWHNNDQEALINGDEDKKIFSSKVKLLRGGSCIDNPINCSSSFRFGNSLNNRFSNSGFRLVLD